MSQTWEIVSRGAFKKKLARSVLETATASAHWAYFPMKTKKPNKPWKQFANLLGSVTTALYLCLVARLAKNVKERLVVLILHFYGWNTAFKCSIWCFLKCWGACYMSWQLVDHRADWWYTMPWRVSLNATVPQYSNPARHLLLNPLSVWHVFPSRSAFVKMLLMW